MSQDHPNPRRRPKKKPEVSLTRSSAAEYLTFVAASGEGGVEAVYADENVWLSQKMMGLLYDVETHTINYHLKKIFSDQELQENSVIRNFRITAADCKFYDTMLLLPNFQPPPPVTLYSPQRPALLHHSSNSCFFSH